MKQNWVPSNKNMLSLKSCYDNNHLTPDRYESDLSNEVLHLLEGQDAAKILEIKVGGKKNVPE